MTTGYPAILLIQDRLAVVIGGGAVGERKVRTLLEAGARVRVIATDPAPSVDELARHERVQIVRRSYREGDLEGAVLVVAATDDRSVNQRISIEAGELGIPVNVVDDVELCTFIAPSIVRRGDLVIAVSTGGVNPALTVRLRERLEKEFGDEYARYLDLIKSLKATASAGGTQEERAAAWYRVVDSEVLDLVRQGKTGDARDLAISLIEGEAQGDRAIVSGSSAGGE